MGVKSSDMLTYNGETHSFAEWCKIKGFHRNTLAYRLNSGMSIAEALEAQINHSQSMRAKQIVKANQNNRRYDANCKDCKYSMITTWDGRYYACDYLGMTGKRRPCEPGDGCTVKEKLNGKRRKTEPDGKKVWR